MSSMTVDETPSAALRASVVDELRLLDAHPPEDEYADLPENPPAYNSFEVAYEHWCDTDNAKLAMLALDQDPAIAATETELKAARQLLKRLQATSKELFDKSRKKRNSFTSYFGFGKSNRKANHSLVDASVTTSHSSTEPDSPATEMFRKAHEAGMKQGLVVDSLAAKIEEFRRKREALNDIASGGSLAWNRLRRIVDGTLSGRVELAVAMGEAMERLESVESAYNVAKKMSTDLTRACLTVQHAHHYFTRALRICDDIRGTSVGRAMIGGLGGDGGINEMTKKIQYQDSVKMASKAQICLDEMFRVMEHHEHMIPAERMEDYKALKKLGLMQMSKIYNLMWGGSFVADGVSGSVKLLLGRQEAAFAHLTPLAVWIQDRAPVCSMEEKLAEKLRDDVRRQIAATWNTSISIRNRS